MATGGLYIYDKDNISGNLTKVPVGNLQKNKFHKKIIQNCY